MKILAIYNLKGGVGKTSTAVNMAYLASQQGFRTLLWDLDPQGASSWYFDGTHTRKVSAKKILKTNETSFKYVIKTKYENLDIIPADISFRDLDPLLKDMDTNKQLADIMHQFSDNYSLIIFDCPPGITRLTENIFFATDAILLPMIPTWLSLHSYDLLMTFMKEHGFSRKEIYPFFSMLDNRKKLHQDWLRLPPAKIKKLLKTSIQYSASIEKMGEHRAPLETFSEKSSEAEAYRNLWKEINKKLGVR